MVGLHIDFLNELCSRCTSMANCKTSKSHGTLYQLRNCGSRTGWDHRISSLYLFTL